jgi:tetratricopeptide (TPR) repeat protein
MTTRLENRSKFPPRSWRWRGAHLWGFIAASSVIAGKAQAQADGAAHNNRAGEVAHATTASNDDAATHPAPSPPRDESTEATDAFAQRHWHSGMAYLEEGDYQRALEAFNKAYELSSRPALLRSIAVAHEKLGDLPRAMMAIDLYLKQVPNAPQAIHTYRAQLQARFDQEQARVAASAQTDVEENTSTAAAPKPYVLPEPAPRLETPPHAPATNARDVVMWSAFGAGIVFGAGATLTAVQATSTYDELEQTCGQRCSRQQTHEGRTLALTSTVLTGLAVLATTAGVWAWLSSDESTAPPNSTPAASLAPDFDADYAKSRFMSHATWRF